MDIPSKTLENRYLVMNRQIWTNEKSFLSRHREMEGWLNDNCKLCERRENTMHLLFACEKYSEPLWTLTENIFKEAIRAQEGGEGQITTSGFMLLDNVQHYRWDTQQILRDHYDHYTGN
jgi:hypothetical protein